MFQVINQYGIPFNVRIVQQGERYGRQDCLEHPDRMPMVEFYDDRYHDCEEWKERGQFVARYYLDTFFQIQGRGVVLDGGITDWQLGWLEVQAVQKWFLMGCPE